MKQNADWLLEGFVFIVGAIVCIAIAIAIAITLSSCIDTTDQPVEETPIYDHDIMAKAAAAYNEDGTYPAPLTCLTGLLHAHYIAKPRWTAPTEGTTSVLYEVQMNYTVTDTALWMLKAGKGDVVVKVRGIDANGNIGPWSEESDPYLVRPAVPGAAQ